MQPRRSAEYFGSHRDKLLGLALIPEAAAETGVVICGSLLAEPSGSADRDRELAGALATAGHAVARFHFRGDGQSQGRTEDLTLQTMIEDCDDALGWLREVAGVSSLAVCGAGLGALAAASAPQARGLPLAIWKPVFDVGTYFQQMAGIKITTEMGFDLSPRSENGATTLHEQVAHDLLEDEMSKNGFVDFLGFPIGAALYQSTIHHRLADALQASARPLLLVSMDTEVEGHDAVGIPTEVSAGPDAFDETVSWINRQLSESRT